MNIIRTKIEDHELMESVTRNGPTINLKFPKIVELDASTRTALESVTSSPNNTKEPLLAVGPWSDGPIDATIFPQVPPGYPPPTPWRTHRDIPETLQLRTKFIENVTNIETVRILWKKGWIDTVEAKTMVFTLMRKHLVHFDDLIPTDKAMLDQTEREFDLFVRAQASLHEKSTPSKMAGKIHAELTAGKGPRSSEDEFDRPFLIRNREIRITIPHGIFTPSLTSLLYANNIQIKKDDKVYEAGFGTGFLVVLASKLGAKSIKGSEIDEKYLPIAQHNAKQNGITDYDFVIADLFPEEMEPQDIIIANLPQTPKMEGVENKHIDSGEDGTDTILRFLKEAKTKLAPNGRIYTVVASIANAPRVREFIKENYTSAKVVATQELPVPDYVLERLETPHFQHLIQTGEIFQKDGRYYTKDELYELSNPTN